MFAVTQRHQPRILITGGAGFIGSNLAAGFLAHTDASITVLDNLASPGSAVNLGWLSEQARSSRMRFVQADVRDARAVEDAARGADEIYHLAAHCDGSLHSQEDFDVNVTGTLHVLEAARRSGRKPSVVYVSTSKVYSPVRRDALQPLGARWQPAGDFAGISERTPANFTSPQVCSKGAADRYVLDYARLYKLPTVVLRPDTVAGPRQFEQAGHGWIAHFVYSVLAGKPVSVFGTGMQVCDALHVADVVSAIAAARDFIGVTAGNAYNIGGGRSHTISVAEMIALIERVCHRTAYVNHAPSRPGDRLFYMADTSAFVADTGWTVRRSLEQMVRDMASFWHANQGKFAQNFASVEAPRTYASAAA